MTYPKELMERKQWVNWRLIPDKDGGKDKKARRGGSRRVGRVCRAPGYPAY